MASAVACIQQRHEGDAENTQHEDTAMTSTFIVEELEARFEMLTATEEQAEAESDGSCTLTGTSNC
jgi:hypothetical protein